MDHIQCSKIANIQTSNSSENVRYSYFRLLVIFFDTILTQQKNLHLQNGIKTWILNTLLKVIRIDKVTTEGLKDLSLINLTNKIRGFIIGYDKRMRFYYNSLRHYKIKANKMSKNIKVLKFKYKSLKRLHSGLSRSKNKAQSELKDERNTDLPIKKETNNVLHLTNNKRIPKDIKLLLTILKV